MKSKEERKNLASNQFPMYSPQFGTLREVHRVTQRREEGGRRQRCPGGLRGESKGERQTQPVISSLSVLHSLEHPERVTELSREEKGKGGDRCDLGEKKESQKGRDQSGQ